MLIKRGSKSPQNAEPESPKSDHPVQARESGCMITASTAHHINGNLTLASAYYNKIFTQISGPPRWLAQRHQLTFVPVSLPNNNYYLRYNPKWELPKPPSFRRTPCPHRDLSGREPLCMCSCCHYHCQLIHPNTTTTPNNYRMSTPYNSSIDHPLIVETPKPSPPPTSPRYQPSPIPCNLSPKLEKSSSPEIVSHQKDQETQTYLEFTPPPYPHPITIATQVKEHYPNPKPFLKVFHHTLDSLYSETPHCPRPTPDVFRETSPLPSAPVIPRPKAAFSEGPNPSLEDTLLLHHLLNNKELEIPILTYCQPGSPLLTIYHAHQANHCLKNIRATDSLIYKQETDLINTIHRLGRFSFLQELYHLPLRYVSSRESFCLSCYHVGHYQENCIHYQCASCLHWQPGHKPLTCPCNYPYQPPPRHSPCIQKQSSSSSSSSYKSFPPKPKTVKKQKKGEFAPKPIPDPSRKGKQREEEHLDKLVEEICTDPVFNYDDNAISNMTRELCGDF